MQKNTFCTIITVDYLPVAKVLKASLLQHGNTNIFILIVDADQTLNAEDNILSLSDLFESHYFKLIYKKYAHTNKDVLRWALKPVLIGHLLEKGYEKVIFLDPDTYFVNKYDFLFELLNTHSILLTPHWANLDIIGSENSVIPVLQNGLFNAGFIAANQKGLLAIEWWAGMCHFKMEKKPEIGIYDDQKYLDLLSVQFNDVYILKHQGCNLASWNIQSCRREIINGRLVINKLFEPVFIHFAKDTIINILNKNDQLLKLYLDEYIKALQNENFDLLKRLDKVNIQNYNSIQYSVKHKLRLRTRLKRFLFKLAEKL